MLWTARHENQLRSNGFWHEKWHTNLLCRNKSSRSTPSVNQERDAVLSTPTWIRCLLWSVSKDTPGCWGLNHVVMCSGGWWNTPRELDTEFSFPGAGPLVWLMGTRAGSIRGSRLVWSLRWEDKWSAGISDWKGERHRKQKVLPFQDYTFFPRNSLSFALPCLAFLFEWFLTLFILDSTCVFLNYF